MNQQQGILSRLWEAIKSAFTEAGVEVPEEMQTLRSVVDVAQWDGSASNYSSTAEYCQACLINVNEGPKDGWTQDNCKLPVMKPGGTAYVRQAIHAAAAALAGGRGGVKKPDGCSADTWNSAMKKAANELLTAYKQAGEDAPDSLYEVAGKTPPQRANVRTIGMSQLFAEVQDLLRDLNSAAWEMDPTSGMTYINPDKYYSILDLYWDGPDLFAVLSQGGKLIRAPVQITETQDENGMSEQDVAFGDFAEIPLNARAVLPTFRSFISADGKRKWTAIACTSVLNRVNEIDSTRLFDSFVAHIEKTGQYPVLSFYHADDVVRWGVATFAARDGDLYCLAGEWDDTPEAQRAAEHFEKSTERWGTSIGYTSTKPPEWLEVVQGVSIPVYVEGVNSEVSIVLEREAAAYLTAFGTQEVTRMKKTDVAYQRLVEQFGETYANQYLEDINGAQRTIQDSNPIRRTDVPVQPVAETSAPAPVAQPTEGTPVVTPEVPPTPEPQTQVRELEIPDELFTALVEAVATSDVMKGQFAALATQLESLTQQVAGTHQLVEQSATETSQRLAVLEQTDEQRRAAWQADLAVPQTVRISRRPSETRTDTGQNGQQPQTTYENVANQTLAALKSRASS